MKTSIPLWLIALTLASAMPLQGQNNKLYLKTDKMDSVALSSVGKIIFQGNNMRIYPKGNSVVRTYETNAIMQMNFRAYGAVSARVPYALLDVSVFPNPTNGKLTIVNTHGGKISIYNMYGALLAEYMQRGNSMELNISHFPAGVYYLQINSENGMAVQKIIKN